MVTKITIVPVGNKGVTARAVAATEVHRITLGQISIDGLVELFLAHIATRDMATTAGNTENPIQRTGYIVRVSARPRV